MAQNESANAAIIHMPSFMETAATGWFAIIEAQFKLRSITTSSTKFYHVLSSLPPELVARLPAPILTEAKYEELKEAVINIHEKTKPELFARLINDTKMSGRPSYYLQELNATATKVGVGEDLVRHRFINALPSTISPVIAAQKDLTLQQLGNLADELMPILQNNAFHIADVSNPSPSNKRRVSASSTSGQPMGLKPFNQDQRPKVCRGHIFFGRKSRTCKPWCQWPNKSNCQIQPNSRSSSPAPNSNQEN